MKLKDIAVYAKDRIEIKDLSVHNYISTENMMPDKGGVQNASSLPSISFTSGFTVNDVLTSNIRPYFRKIWFSDKEGGCSNDVLVLRAKEKCNPKFLYYVLSDNRFFDYSTASAKGTKMPRGDKAAIMEYEVPNFDIAEQIKIANLLSSFDSKIALNKRINDNLEKQAQALYKSWFVDFEPFKGVKFIDSELGEIPEGWSVGTLRDLIIVKYGKDHKKLHDGKIPVYGSGGVMRYVDEYLYSGESVLIPRKGTLNNVFYVNEKFWSVDTMFYTQMKQRYIAKYIYFFVSSQDLISMNAGSAVPSMTTEILNSLKCVMAPLSVMERFDVLQTPIFETMRKNSIESEKLSEIRDSLLPKLMSGEIKINDSHS